MSQGSDRRTRLLDVLRETDGSVTGSKLSAELGVSRQAIVNDIAILRAGGQPILGTPNGYLYGGESTAGTIALVACKHDREGSREELETFVDHGCTVVDVVVEHALYGEVRANLMIATRADVDRYMELLYAREAQVLSALTGGVHLHHVKVPDQGALGSARRSLAELGILLED